MIWRMYSVRDKAVQAFMQPFFARSDLEAIRMWSDAIDNPQSGFRAHAGDYDLYSVGVFNDGDAVCAGVEVNRIATGLGILNALGAPPPSASSE